MKEDPELLMNDDEITYSPKRRRIESNSNKILPIFLGIVLIVIFAGGIFYFITRHTMEGDATYQTKIAALDQKIVSLERQVVDLQGKLGPAGPDSAFLQRLEALAQKVEALEKRAQSTVELKSKPAPSKPAVTTQKRYHTVQKGETLYRISKKYGITVEELRKLNNLSANQSVRTGQKLLISLER
jgi:LysM repeat protein